jgi:hypothetical protein
MITLSGSAGARKRGWLIDVDTVTDPRAPDKPVLPAVVLGE